MGATTFYTKTFGEDADKAFRKSLRQARRRHGTAPYSGTISEKNSYTVIPSEEYAGKNRERYASMLIEKHDDRIDSAGAPAGAISLSGTKAAREYREDNDLKGKHGSVWLFFGLAIC